MSEELADRYAELLTQYSRVAVAGMLLLSLAIGAGAVFGADTENVGVGDFDIDTESQDALDRIDATYGADDRTITQYVVRDEGGNVLTRESLLAGLRFQEDALDDETIARTVDEQGFLAVENLVGTVAALEDRDGQPDPDAEPPTLEEQITALETRSSEEVAAIVETVLAEEQPAPGAGDPREFLPQSYEPTSTTADARIGFLFHPGDDLDAVGDAQIRLEELFDDRFDDGFVFGQGIIDRASSASIGDSFIIITPVAIVFVLTVFAVTYRDVLDISLGVLGILLVLAWLFGVMGWLAIPMSVFSIATPFLLIGLAVDYSIHVIMRYREARSGTLEQRQVIADGGLRDVRTGMRVGLASVVLALAAATVSTSVGFLSNITNPLSTLQEFAVVSAAGIVGTFLIFAVFVPAAKLELDQLLEQRFGRSRNKRAFGVESGRLSVGLAGLARTIARRPIAVIAVALLLTSGGIVAATDIDTEFNQQDFLPQDAPDWAKSLPGSFAAGTYTIADDAEYLAANFRQRGPEGQTQLLLEGDITDPETVRALESGIDRDVTGTTILTQPDGSPAIDAPTTLFASLSDNETVAQLRDQIAAGEADSDDVVALYDLAYELDPEQAREVIYRTEDGTYESLRVLLAVDSSASAQTVASDTRAVGDDIAGAGPATVTATGQLVVTADTQDVLLDTIIEALSITLLVIGGFLTALYWVRYRSYTLGLVTLVPVAAALTWLIGTMAVVDVTFNSETAVVTSLAIGLGVDYSIHVTERFVDEYAATDSIPNAMEATLTGTGGALLGSVATTAGGFGLLALALSPPIQRFGIVTGVGIVLAFLACLVVLPALLVARQRIIDRRRERDA